MCDLAPVENKVGNYCYLFVKDHDRDDIKKAKDAGYTTNVTKKVHSWFKNGFISNVVSTIGCLMGLIAVWRKQSVLIECAGSIILISNCLG